MGKQGNRAFGEWLRQVRRARGLSQKRLGEALGVYPTAVCHWENGRVAPPRAALAALAAHFGRDPEELAILAGVLPPDLLAILQAHPREAAALLRRRFAPRD